MSSLGQYLDATKGTKFMPTDSEIVAELEKKTELKVLKLWREQDKLALREAYEAITKSWLQFPGGGYPDVCAHCREAGSYEVPTHVATCIVLVAEGWLKENPQ